MSPIDDVPRTSRRPVDGVTRVNPPGQPFPLGATAHPTGTQFAVHAPGADGVEVCLIDPDGGELAKWTGTISGADIKAKTV